MRRHPDGVRGSGFYQQRAPADTPPGVRVATLASDRVVPRRYIGGSLGTLLHMTHVAAISQDPWFSRVQSEETPDHAVLDLDPMPGAFRRARGVDLSAVISGTPASGRTPPRRPPALRSAR